MSFLRAIDHESIWHLRIVKGALVLMSVLFSVGLLAQWVYQERDRLASAQPALKPVLDALCAPLNCAVQAVHRIESIAIDAAAFNKLGVDSYRLSFVVKNLASQVLALPGIELTLTDSQDQVVLRRVLSPTDLFATSDALAPGSEWPVTVLVRVQADTTAARVVGYRLLAFYP